MDYHLLPDGELGLNYPDVSGIGSHILDSWCFCEPFFDNVKWVHRRIVWI